jgi:hypothetical protein
MTTTTMTDSFDFDDDMNLKDHQNGAVVAVVDASIAGVVGGGVDNLSVVGVGDVVAVVDTNNPNNSVEIEHVLFLRRQQQRNVRFDNS